MSRVHSYLKSAGEILAAHQGNGPFAPFLKKQFAANKQFGSRDRKQIAHLCYCYFRLGKAFYSESMEERLLLGLFLCSAVSQDILLHLKPMWNNQIQLPFSEKQKWIHQALNPAEVFPWSNDLSNGIDRQAFSLSHLQQPLFFIRLRPGNKINVEQKLKAAGLNYHWMDDSCIALLNGIQLEDVLLLNKEVVVQDFSSQRLGYFMKKINAATEPLQVWDCCAASGGKSILAYDLLPGCKLTVTDIRESILANLRKRFQQAAIKVDSSFVADLAKPVVIPELKKQRFDLLLADVPCSGSGTWSRTPEQLHFFDPAQIDTYVALQQKIIRNAVTLLKPGGYLLYSTCSVFQKENEAQVEWMKQECKLELLESSIIHGYTIKADTMFGALFRKQ